MRKLHNKKGFTLAEILLVVAILAILVGLAFVAVNSYQRSMTKLEYDGYAREIFIAAQNHLSMAKSQGYLGVTDFGTQDASDPSVYYFAVNVDGGTSLSAEGVAPPPPDDLIAAFVDKLDRAVYEDRALIDEAAAARFVDRMQPRSYLAGKTVKCVVNGAPLTGVFTGVAPTGAALLRLPDGSVREIISGEIVL